MFRYYVVDAQSMNIKFSSYLFKWHGNTRATQRRQLDRKKFMFRVKYVK